MGTTKNPKLTTKRTTGCHLPYCYLPSLGGTRVSGKWQYGKWQPVVRLAARPKPLPHESGPFLIVSTGGHEVLGT
jgi:hypothetical protein